MAVLALGTAAFSCNVEKAEDQMPNIIVIMSDDAGYSDVGCFGSEINTPNIDKLGYEGVRFSRFYSGAKCEPSRSSLFTGLYQGVTVQLTLFKSFVTRVTMLYMQVRNILWAGCRRVLMQPM
jgi:hypothetical protein